MCNTQLWMTQEIIRDWEKVEKKVFPPRAKEAQPTERSTPPAKPTFGAEPIEYGLHGDGHTDGDILRVLPAIERVAVGDVIQAARLPMLDFTTGGWIGGMQEAHRTVLRLANTRRRLFPVPGR